MPSTSRIAALATSPYYPAFENNIGYMGLVETFADGRGWFRTSDLSRVKRRVAPMSEGPESALPSGMRRCAG